MNRDFLDMLSTRNEANAEYVVVGAHAGAAHGSPRATGDIAIWIRATRENAERVLEALRRFGSPLYDLTVEDLSSPDVVFQIGVPPVRIRGGIRHRVKEKGGDRSRPVEGVLCRQGRLDREQAGGRSSEGPGGRGRSARTRRTGRRSDAR